MLLIRDCRTLKKCPLLLCMQLGMIGRSQNTFLRKKKENVFVQTREREWFMTQKVHLSNLADGRSCEWSQNFSLDCLKKKVEFSHGTFNGFLALDSVKSIKIPFKFSILKTSYEFYLWLDLFYIHFIHILDLFI